MMTEADMLKESLIKGDVERVREYMKKEGSDVILDDKRRPIHYACEKGHIDIAKILITMKCDMECEDDLKRRPIHYACENGHIDIVKLLIEMKCDMEFEDNSKRRPIHYACENRHIDIAKLLITNKCDMECEDNRKRRSIHYACENGHVDIAKLLITNKCDIDCEDHLKIRPIRYACENGHIDIVKLLIEMGCDKKWEDDCKRRPIHYACENGHIDIVKLLITMKCDMECEDNRKRRPIHYACEKGHIDIVKLLITMKCDMECEDNRKIRPIHYACMAHFDKCEKGQIEIVKLLITMGCDMKCEDEEKLRPIHVACKSGNAELVKLLIDQKCNIECEDVKKQRPIHFACWSGDVEVVKLLMKENCNIHCTDSDNHTPFYWAFVNGHNNVMEILSEEKRKLTHNSNLKCENDIKEIKELENKCDDVNVNRQNEMKREVKMIKDDLCENKGLLERLSNVLEYETDECKKWNELNEIMRSIIDKKLIDNQKLFLKHKKFILKTYCDQFTERIINKLKEKKSFDKTERDIINGFCNFLNIIGKIFPSSKYHKLKLDIYLKIFICLEKLKEFVHDNIYAVRIAEIFLYCICNVLKTERLSSKPSGFNDTVKKYMDKENFFEVLREFYNCPTSESIKLAASVASASFFIMDIIDIKENDVHQIKKYLKETVKEAIKTNEYRGFSEEEINIAINHCLLSNIKMFFKMETDQYERLEQLNSDLCECFGTSLVKKDYFTHVVLTIVTRILSLFGDPMKNKDEAYNNRIIGKFTRRESFNKSDRALVNIFCNSLNIIGQNSSSYLLPKFEFDIYEIIFIYLNDLEEFVHTNIYAVRIIEVLLYCLCNLLKNKSCQYQFINVYSNRKRRDEDSKDSRVILKYYRCCSTSESIKLAAAVSLATIHDNLHILENDTKREIQRYLKEVVENMNKLNVKEYLGFSIHEINNVIEKKEIIADNMGLNCAEDCSHSIFCRESFLQYLENENCIRENWNEVGEGSFGKVYRLKESRSIRPFVLKRVELGTYPEPNRMIKRMVNICSQRLQHEHIVIFFGTIERDNTLNIFMEDMEGGSLKDYISQNKNQRSSEWKYYCRKITDMTKQILQAVSFLHQNSVIHRDIKPDNLLLDRNQDKVKLSDFGVSRFCSYNWSSESITVYGTACGTLGYIAPEIRKNERYDYSADIWSVGATVYHMLTGEVPPKYKYNLVIRGEKIQKEELYRLMTKMVEIKPRKRPTAGELLRETIFVEGLDPGSSNSDELN